MADGMGKWEQCVSSTPAYYLRKETNLALTPEEHPEQNSSYWILIE